MYFIYIDDSGDTGLMNKGSPTKAYVLSALVVPHTDWLDMLDELIEFRRFLRDEFGVKVRDELKAGYLVHGTGPFAGVGQKARMRIYRMAMRFQRKVALLEEGKIGGRLQAWAVVINKAEWENQGKRAESEAIHETAWQYMLNRIERFTHYGDDTCIVFPDEGHPDAVRTITRKMRRQSLVPSMYDPDVKLKVPVRLMLEDPNFRRSSESYFVQLADLNSYAAYRRVFPEPWFGTAFWEELGGVRVEAVNKYRPGPKGIVVRP